MTILAVTIDIDQDGMAFGVERDELRWTSVEIVPRLAEVFAARGVRATWFIRADNQLADVYGNAAWLLEEYEDLWSSLRDAGHDLAWHPHVYRRGESGGYETETDGSRCAEQLEWIHGDLTARGHRFGAVRVGEAFHANEAMQTLDRLGLRIDSTAIPGRKRNDAGRMFDWEPTANEPYHPSRTDYRVPGPDALSILEVPMTSIPIRAPYDEVALRRYVNLAYRADLLGPALAEHADGLSTLVTIVHPEEAVRSPGNPLYGEGLPEIERNLDLILARGVTVKTMSELV